MKPAPFAYVRPESLEEAIDVLDDRGEDARVLAGGQSLMATLNMRLSAPEVLVDIGASLASRASASHRRHDPPCGGGGLGPRRSRAPLIASAMPHIAHPAVRNCGTFGGSIASPIRRPSSRPARSP